MQQSPGDNCCPFTVHGTERCTRAGGRKPLLSCRPKANCEQKKKQLSNQLHLLLVGTGSPERPAVPVTERYWPDMFGVFILAPLVGQGLATVWQLRSVMRNTAHATTLPVPSTPGSCWRSCGQDRGAFLTAPALLLKDTGLSPHQHLFPAPFLVLHIWVTSWGCCVNT